MQRNVTQNLQKLQVTVFFNTEQSLDRQRGKVSCVDMPRTGRPKTVRTDVARAVIAHCLEDRRWSLQELQAHTGIDQANVHKILREDLDMRKIAALTQQQK